MARSHGCGEFSVARMKSGGPGSLPGQGQNQAIWLRNAAYSLVGQIPERPHKDTPP